MRHPTVHPTLSGLPACGTFICVIPFFFFLFGIVIGSFLNVCITRIPDGISIISPGSRCPRCLTPIKPSDNIPILSWILLRGKCRHCALPISAIYPIVEFLTGALFLLTYYTFGVTIRSFELLLFASLMVILIFTDLRVRLLPDAVNWFGFGVALAFATKIAPGNFMEIWLHDRPVPPVVIRVADALLGAAFGSLLLWGAAALYKAVRKREGMGMGDVKMMAMVGAFLGVRGAFLTILIGTLLGSLIGLVTVLALYLFGWKQDLAARAHRRGLGGLNALRWTIASQYQLPLGTFLGIAALLVVYVRPWLGPGFA